MMHVTDLHRDLSKIADTLDVVNRHLGRKDEMNAALHMSGEVRPTPLAAAVMTAVADLDRILKELNQGVDNTPS